MRNMMRRKLAIGLAGAVMTALSVAAVAPVAAQDAGQAGTIENTSQIDTAAAQAQEALNGPEIDAQTATYAIPAPLPAPVIVQAPTIYTPGVLVPVAPAAVIPVQAQPAPDVTAVTTQPDGEMTGPYQIDRSVDRDNDTADSQPDQG